jgi:hypothetical protein
VYNPGIVAANDEYPTWIVAFDITPIPRKLPKGEPENGSIKQKAD